MINHDSNLGHQVYSTVRDILSITDMSKPDLTAKSLLVPIGFLFMKSFGDDVSTEAYSDQYTHSDATKVLPDADSNVSTYEEKLKDHVSSIFEDDPLLCDVTDKFEVFKEENKDDVMQLSHSMIEVMNCVTDIYGPVK